MPVYRSSMEIISSPKSDPQNVSTNCRESAPSNELHIGQNPLPIFSAINPDIAVALQGVLPEKDYLHLGKNAALRVLPYKMQDRYARATELVTIATIILENNFLRATFLPDYGARLWSLYCKREERELLFCNPVLQFANLAIRNAWFSGGIEWNVAQFGHTFGTCSSMFAALCRDDGGREFLRFYQFERCREIFWQLDFHLPPGAETLRLYAKIINASEHASPMYWWTNIAVPETSGARVFSADERVLYIVPRADDTDENNEKNKDKDDENYGEAKCLPPCFAQGRLPNIASLAGRDASYPGNFSHSSEYFFQNDSLAETAGGPDASAASGAPGISGATEYPWEAVSYEDGRVFFERSSSRLRYRKMFCWGRHTGGQNWKDFLSRPGEGDYLEIQAGMAPTQLHGLEMAANSEWDFVQVFGGQKSSEILPGQSPQNSENLQNFSGEWRRSCQEIKALVDRHIPPQKIAEWQNIYRQLGRQKPEKLLHLADGWGALELYRRQKSGRELRLKSMIFPPETLGSQQQEWLHLLNYGILPRPSTAPGHTTSGAANFAGETSSWLVSRHWLHLLEESLGREGGDHWYSRLHLGVMQREHGQCAKAAAQWQKSLQQLENPLAYRNLAYCDRLEGRWESASQWYKKIFQMGLSHLDKAYAEEYMETLLQLKRYAEVWDFYRQQQYDSGRIAVLAGRAAVELERWDYVTKLLQTGYPQLKEGENWLTDIWYIAKAKELAKELSGKLGRGEKLPSDYELRRLVQKKYTPPATLDFRMK